MTDGRHTRRLPEFSRRAPFGPRRQMFSPRGKFDATGDTRRYKSWIGMSAGFIEKKSVFCSFHFSKTILSMRSNQLFSIIKIIKPWKEYLRKMEKVFSVLTQCNGPPPLLISARIRASFLFSSFHPLPFVRSAAGCSSWITAFRLVRLLLQRRCHRPRISIRHVQFAVVGIRFSRNCAPHGAASCLLPLPSSNRSSLGGKEREVACEKFLPLQYGNNSLFLFHESFHHSLYVPMNLKLNRSYYHGNNFIRTYDKCAGRQMVMSRR